MSSPSKRAAFRYVHRAWGGYTVMGDLSQAIDKPMVIILPKQSTIGKFGVNIADGRYNLKFNIELVLGSVMEERLFVLTTDKEKHNNLGLTTVHREVHNIFLVEIKNPVMEESVDLKYKVSMHEGKGKSLSHVTDLSLDGVITKISRLKDDGYITVKRNDSNEG